MATIWTIAKLTFREAARRKILLAAVLLGLLFLLIYALGFHFVISEMRREQETAVLEIKTIFNFLLMAGLYVVNFMLVMMTVLTSVDTLSGEINSGTIHTMLSKPIRRDEIILGKWLGFAILLSLYLLLMAGGVMAVVFLFSGYIAPNALTGLGLMVLNSILLLSLSLYGGARFSTLTNGVLVFSLYGIAFLGGWIEQIGSILQNQTAVNIGIISSLIFPSEILWKRAAFEMQSPLLSAMGFSPFSAPSVPSLLMVGYAALYATLAIGMAVRKFQRRDL